MKLAIGQRVEIKISAEEMQNDLLSLIDGATATISEIYKNQYEPNVVRIEVELDEPVDLNGERVRVVPGLYEDNIIQSNMNESKKQVKSFLAFQKFGIR